MMGYTLSLFDNGTQWLWNEFTQRFYSQDGVQRSRTFTDFSRLYGA